jgi:hypothetical protein
MGMVYADIELINAWELENAKRHIIGEDEVKRMHVNALVHTGSYMLCINENIREQLQLSVLKKRKEQMADGSIKEYEVAGPVELRFKNRRTLVNAMVLPGDNEVLFGAILMEDMRQSRFHI